MEALRTLLDRYLASGDEGAIDELVARTRPRLLKAARRIGAPQDAEDAVQGAYLALTRKGAALDAPVFPWLLTAVVRIAYRRKALERRQVDLARRLAQPRAAGSPAAAAIDAETVARVRADVARLPAKYRDIVVLRYLQGLSTPEIARLLGMPDATVRTRLARGRALLRGPLAPLWLSALLLVPWLAVDIGGRAVRKKTLALALPLLLVTAGGGVWFAATRRGAERAATRAAPAPLAVRATEPGPSGADVPVPAGPALRGVVQDRAGRPVADARVRVGDGAVRSDAAGRFVAPVSGDEPHYRVLVEAAGYSPALRAHAVPGADVVVTLEEAPVLTGTVRDIGSRPVAGARLTWRMVLDGVAYERGAVTDTAGRYRVADLPSPFAFPLIDSYMATFRVDAAGYAPLRVRAPVPSPRGPGELTMDLFVSAGATLRGRVVDAETGAGLPRARVELRTLRSGGGHPTLAAAVADGDGRFVMERVPASGYHDVVALQSGGNRWLGWLRAEAEGRLPASVDVAVPADGRVHEYAVRCHRPATVRGRVAGAGAGVRVDATAVGAPPTSIYDRSGFNETVATDAAGRYEVAVVPGRVYVSSGQAMRDVVARAGQTVEAPDLVPETGPARYAVVAEVVDEAGAPVWGARVEAGRVWSRTGRDGRARIELPDPQPVAVRAWSHLSGSRTAAPVAPSVDRPPVVRVVLDATRAIEGEVSWEDGEPAAGIQLMVQDAARIAGHALSGRDGTFRAARLADGAHTVTARAWDETGQTVEASVEARAGATGVRLVLPRLPEAETVVVEGTLRAHGRPLLDFACTLSDGTRFVRAERAGPGRFRFPRAPLGTWTLRVTATGFAPKAVRGIVLRHGAPPPPLAIDLEGGATVRGRIRGGDEGDLLNLVLVTADGFVSKAPHVRAGKGYRMPDVRPGRYRPLLFGAKGWVARPTELVVGEDDVTFDVEIVRGATVRFGPEAVRAGIVVRDADGETVFERADPGQGFGMIGLPTGAYELRVGDDERPLTIRAGEDVSVLR